ncbi:pheromone transporter [Rhodotorula toruloides]|uniref:Pheromone transporter n=1 Tax=Rhodotorula toruloides TaxID=5286 RepID=A0A511KIH5_RHOTO|nr:pheromone transporter [Rhodotorula toruloides]
MQPAASTETLHILSGGGTDDDKEPVRWTVGEEDAAVEPFGARSQPRPAPLDLSRDTANVPNLRYSITSSASEAKPPAHAKPPSVQPSLGLLFSLTTRQTFLTIVVPGIVCAIVAGLVPPYMTQILGDALQAYTDFGLATAAPDLSHEALKAARSQLLNAIRNKAIKFAVIAAVVFFFSSTNVALWTIHGERAAHELRMKVYRGVSEKSLEWHDRGMGGAADGGAEGGDGGKADAAGLMGRFTKDTDDVRMGASSTIGLIIQYLSSFIFCIILAFYRNWRLSFVVLATIPVVAFFVGLTERFSGPLANQVREATTQCSSRVDRVIGAIPTVKAFNAEEEELKGFKELTKKDFVAYVKLHFVWGLRSGVVQFLLMSMFVQGFWFGAYLIKTGEATAASVNTCFWACLLGSTYLQTCIPFLVTLEKGKIAMAGLLTLIRDEPPASPSTLTRSPPPSAAGTFGVRRKAHHREGSSFGTMTDASAYPLAARDEKAELNDDLSHHPFHSVASPTTPHTPVLIPIAGTTGTRRTGAPRALKKLCPATFSGELSLRNVTFHYPTRPAPAPPALRDVSLYFAARETTYIVGTSGSGKSTVGSLLMALYRPDLGRIEVDEQGLEWIDEDWLRGHVACVSQGASVLFDGTIHDNVAVGVVGQLQEDGTKRRKEDVTREEVIAACRGALIHDFIRDLPDGYDTWISGEKGASLSGGQRQRLAIARAWVRNPTVLILDEAMSALDATSRLLVNEAVKRWRDNRTTVVITHDLAPIGPDDFVYVMVDGSVVEQGFRNDLEADRSGHFAKLASSQQGACAGGVGDNEEEVLDLEDFHATPRTVGEAYGSTHSTPRIQISAVDAEDSSSVRYSAPGLFFPPTGDVFRASQDSRDGRRASVNFQNAINRSSSPSQSRPSSKQFSAADLLPPFDPPEVRTSRPVSRADSDLSLSALELVTAAAMSSRKPVGPRIKHRTMTEADLQKWARRAGPEGSDTVVDIAGEAISRAPTLSLVQLARRFWPTIPNKLLFSCGVVFSMVVGACTPISSTLLSKVISNLGNPNAGSLITQSALLILLVAFIDGSGSFLKFYCLERCAMGWITALRRRAFGLVLKQDKSFFDRPENSTSALSHSVVKDSEDTRILVGTVVGQCCVLVSMLTLGIVWSFVTGWELTLVGFGIAPVIIVITRLQAAVLNKLEGVNKLRREEVSKRFHQTLANVRAIRSMSVQPVFARTFESTADSAYSSGIKAAPFAGFGFASTFTLTYLSQGLMLYVGALLIVSGRYTFSKMLQVFTLIIFTITFAGSLMNYLPAMAKSLRAANDLLRLLDLKPETSESEGRMTFPVHGHVSFQDVRFAYPSRPDIPILRGLDFQVQAGECVGIVGPSGSGKSTVAALLQRLYEPSDGSVLLDGRPLNRADVRYLRDHVAVVSQHPALFDMSVAQNIAYGRSNITQDEIERAAQAAHIHDFITELPQGYDTLLGDNASLISGGQAQRLQIARALVQSREILILDECTSALDPANQQAVLDTILRVKAGRTTLIVTHKLAIMEKCDRLIVLTNGAVAETGTVAELRAKPRGVFATLASGGEWETS